MLRIGSLFSGIGGLDLGVEFATGGRVVWMAEKDNTARRVLQERFPGVPVFDDVVGLEPPPVDILIGGFPCQDVSQAGTRTGLDGKRSGLWSEFARIIRVLRPPLVFVENVRALTVRGLDHVLGDLAECGYDAEWDCVGACCVGAPHRRERVFILGHLQSGIPDAIGDAIRVERERSREQRRQRGEAVTRNYGHARSLANAGGARREGTEHEQTPRGSRPPVDGAAVADTDGRRREVERVSEHGRQRRSLRGESHGRRNNWRLDFGEIGTWEWPPEPPVGRVAHGVPGRVGQLRTLGNAVVPRQAAEAFRVLYGRALQC